MPRTVKSEKAARGAPAAVALVVPLAGEGAVAPDTAAAEDLFSVATAPPAKVAAGARGVAPDSGAMPIPSGVARVGLPKGRGSATGIGSSLAKPGYGLHMRTADGEETVAPFRSLEDLLSAAKTVLRGAARSSEPVWFSIQPLDLSTVDSEAA